MRRRQTWWRAVACVLLVGTTAVGPAWAQSPFSLVHLGAPCAAGDARMLGRGGWGLAESDTLAPSFRNPAGLPGLRQVAISLAGYGEAARSTGARGERNNRRVMTPNLFVAVPLADGRVVLATGFQARRSTQYETSTPREWTDGSEVLATGDQLFTREGTQFAVPLTLAYRAREDLALSASLNIERGTILERVDHYYLESSDDILFRASSLTREDDLSGTSATFGALFRPLPRLALGATYTTPWTYDVARSLELTNVSGATDSSYTLRMPRSWGVGARAVVAPRWRLGADYERRELSRLRGRPDWQQTAANEWSVAFGCEREGARIRRGGVRNLPLRFGVSLGQWGYSVGGQPVREWRLAAGTGFVFRSGGGRVDVALSYGRVGDRERNGYADDVWRLALSLVGLERWW